MEVVGARVRAAGAPMALPFSFNMFDDEVRAVLLRAQIDRVMTFQEFDALLGARGPKKLSADAILDALD